MNMPRVTAAASIAAPSANNIAPIARERVRPRLSDTAPAKRETTVAGIRIDDTMMPCRDDESVPKEAVKDGMTMTGPIVEVSSLRDRIWSQSKYYVKGRTSERTHGTWTEKREHPKV